MMQSCIFVAISSFALTVRSLGNVTFVKKCPTSQGEWAERSKALDCTEESGLFYHCLRMGNYTLVEGCLYPTSIQSKDGCPWLDVRNGHLRIESQRCEDSVPDCLPDTEDWYKTNNLYKYPGCFLNPSSYGKSTSGSTIGTTDHLEDCCSSESQQRQIHTLQYKSYSTIRYFPTFSEMEAPRTSSDNASNIAQERRSLPWNVLLYAVIGVAGALVALLILLVCCLLRINRRLKRRNVSLSNTVHEHDVGDNEDSTHYDSIQDLQRLKSSTPPEKEEVISVDVIEHAHPYDYALSRSDTSSSNPRSATEFIEEEIQEKDVDENKQETSEYVPLERTTERQVYRSLNSEININNMDYEEPVTNKYEKLLPHIRPENLNWLQGIEYEGLKRDSNNSDAEITVQEGCPWLEIETNKIKYERCDDGTPDCPPNSEEWLSSKDLYKFPGCFERPTHKRFSMATSTKDITVSFQSDTSPALIRNHSTTERTQTSRSLRNVLLSVVLGGAGVVLVILTVTAGTLIIICLNQGHIGKRKLMLGHGSQ